MSPLNFYALNMHSVHWGMKPFKNTTLLFFAKPPLKSANCPSPPAFLGNPPNILVFRETQKDVIKVFEERLQKSTERYSEFTVKYLRESFF